MLQIGNSSNRRVRVFFLGFSVVVRPWDGLERGLYPGGCRVMWCARFSVSSFPRDVFSVCNVSSFEISIPRAYGFFRLHWFRIPFSKVGLFWVETVVLRTFSWGKNGCLGYFVYSRLSIRNSSIR